MSGMNFSFGEATVLPAITNPLSSTGQPPLQYVETMKALLEGQSVAGGNTVNLEALLTPGYKPPEPEFGAPAAPVLSSPRSVHVCMLHGVDPTNLIEKELKDFEKPGLTPDLVQMAYEHHKVRREQKINKLLEERAQLPADFQPPKVKSFSAAPSPGAGGKTPRGASEAAKGAAGRQPRTSSTSTSGAGAGAAAAMDMLGGSTMMQKHAEKTAKQAAQQAALAANRAKYEEMRDQVQREYDEKMAKVNARFILVKAEQKRREIERQKELYDKGQEQIRLAEELELEDRRVAEEEFQAEMVELERQRQEALEDKRLQEEARLLKEKQTQEWIEKTAAIRQEQQDQVDALRAQLDARDVKLEEYNQSLLQLRAERLALSKQNRNATIAANLARAENIEEARKREWIERRIARDAYVAAVKAAENKEGKRAERERLANEKRERAYQNAAEKERARVAKIEASMEKQRLHLLQVEERQKAEAARKQLERQLLMQDRQERVENVGRMREVERMRHREKIEETMARGKLMRDTKAAMAADRQLQNCQASLVDSVRRQTLAEEQRLASRERWLTSINNQKELFAAASTVKTPRPSSAAVTGSRGGVGSPRTPAGKLRPTSSRSGSTAGTPGRQQQPRSQA